MCGIILGYWIIKYFFHYKNVVLISDHTQDIIRGFLYYFNINCMALGGLFAVLVYNKSRIVKWLFKKHVLLITSVVTAILLLFGVDFGFFHYDVYALLFAIIIINLACNPAYKTVLENKTTGYLGSISYGMYMYHLVAITVALEAAAYFQAPWVIYPVAFLLTVLVSHVSYQYFEGYFLRLKSKFS
jgi:peptidoglycan/LPS O-acetylase OafA/YrhL